MIPSAKLLKVKTGLYIIPEDLTATWKAEIGSNNNYSCCKHPDANCTEQEKQR
jgi:hypothetical protein